MSGGGILYVYSRKDEVRTVSVVDKESGRVVRTLDTSKADNKSYWTIHADENVLLVVEWTRLAMSQYKCVHVYENEVHKKTLQLLIRCNNIISTVLCGRGYLLLHTHKTTLAIADLNQSGSNAKFKSVQLLQMTDIYSLVWIARGDDQSGEGYLFATEMKDDAYNSHVYELNLKNAGNGDKLTPLQIPFMNSYGSRNVYFRCTMGTDAILCRDLCGKKTSEYKKWVVPVNILKLEKTINQ